MKRPFASRSHSSGPFVRVNGKIRAREVRVVGQDNHQLGVFSLAEALTMARAQGVDLVEIAPNAAPPVCRLVDYGKFRYEQSKKDKEHRKHQHATKVKEVQLSPNIDPHDLKVKMTHAIEFLCEEMKVKVTLRFRGREMAHKELGFQTVDNFIRQLAPFANPDAPPKLVGRGISVMMNPLPRNKRAKKPAEIELDHGERTPPAMAAPHPAQTSPRPAENSTRVPTDAAIQRPQFGHNPFANLEIKPEPSSEVNS